LFTSLINFPITNNGDINLLNPRPVIGADTTILARGGVPNTVSISLRVAGIDQGTEIFTDTSGLSEFKDEGTQGLIDEYYKQILFKRRRKCVN